MGPILVTGAAGFIGSRFVAACRERGMAVVSVDAAEHFDARPEHAGIDFDRIVDRGALLAWLEDDQPEIGAVVHLGACTDTTRLDVAYLTRMNLEYSKSLWRVATAGGIPFVYASSAAVYGDGSLGYEDDDALTPRLQPLNPYGVSKLRFDAWVLAEEARGATPPAWAGLRFFNVYGFGERHKGAMASVALHAFDEIRATGAVTLFRSHRTGVADGHQRRDFVFVDDVVAVLQWALAPPLGRGIYNVGTGTARTFLDLARAVFVSLGREERIRFVDTPPAIRPRYQYCTQATGERLRAAGWTAPFTSLEEGVGAYVARLRAT